MNANETARVVVEYRFRGYSPPDDLTAIEADDCRITHADVPITADGFLPDVRADLEEMGFEKHGAHLLRTHYARRWNPTWREVWVCRAQ